MNNFETKIVTKESRYIHTQINKDLYYILVDIAKLLKEPLPDLVEYILYSWCKQRFGRKSMSIRERTKEYCSKDSQQK